MDVTQTTTRHEALVGLALAEYVDAQHRQKEEAEANEKGRALKVTDTAHAVAEVAFGYKAAAMLEWTASPVDTAPAQVAEATVTLPSAPYPVTLVFRGWMDDDAEVMTASGALFVRRDCYAGPCDGDSTGHVTRVNSLPELGAVLTDHAAYDLDREHDKPAPPPEWSEPFDPRDV
ncbi:hypothetical protein ACFZAV_42740 [Streptomyces sp. NPDC008343]|uniref:hypothetical protein n=1 Tax=Streptomyces sp. NPDC008343 TaxID=3364828 RepID=UPI0036EC0789